MNNPCVCGHDYDEHHDAKNCQTRIYIGGRVNHCTCVDYEPDTAIINCIICDHPTTGAEICPQCQLVTTR